MSTKIFDDIANACKIAICLMLLILALLCCMKCGYNLIFNNEPPKENILITPRTYEF